jgi:hypothetical protein
MNEPIKIKPNLKLVLAFCFFSVFLFGMLSFHMFCRVIENFEVMTLFFLSLFLILLITTTIFVLSFFSIIKVHENKIVMRKIFSKKTIKLADIKSTIISEAVELNGVLVDRTQIKLMNNELINLYAFKYHNFHHLKIILNHLNKISNNENLKIKKLNLNIKESKRKMAKSEKGKIINFSHILSFSGFVLYSFVFIIFNNLFKNENIKTSNVLESIVTLSFLFLLFSYFTNYFVITKNYLIIKNSIRFWKKECFELSEIESVNINYHYRNSGKTIVIKTKNFEVISFVSDNLLDKNWKSFKDELKHNKILVYDNSDISSKEILY